MTAPLTTRLDEAALLQLRELDPTGKSRLVERVLRAFQTSLARLHPLLQQARSRADMQGVRHVAHTLKSSSQSVGALALSRLCAEIEAAIRDQKFHEVPALLDDMEAELVAVSQATGAVLREPTSS